MTSRVFMRRCTSIYLPILKQYGLSQNSPRYITSLRDVYYTRKYCQPKIDPKYYSCTSIRLFSTDKPTKDDEEPKKLGLVARFKQMYKEYWYVLVPVHLVTSIGWITAFYYVSKSGVDVASLLENMGMSEKLTSHFKDSSLGNIAVAYGLYKIATPVRYTVTLTGTTVSINYLTKYGYIKPVPTTEKMKEMYNEQKNSMKNTFRERKEELRLRKELLKEKKDNIISGYTTFKKELKDIKDK